MRVGAAAGQPVVILLSVDQRYVAGASVVIASALRHIPSELAAEVWVIHAELNQCDVRTLAVAAASGGAALREVRLAPSELALPVKSDYITPATFGRIQMGDVLPTKYHRALYLDCDLLVVGDISELWATDLRDCILAAVAEPTRATVGEPRTYEHSLDPRLDPRLPYFNAGVLLVDLAAWRTEDIAAKALQFIKRFQPRLMDQDALNAVVGDRWLTLEPIWNVTTFWFRSATRQRRFARLLRNAHIVHYVGHRKPWVRRDVWQWQRWAAYLADDAPRLSG